MQVKVYTGNSTTAVLAGIKAELGPDAVILDTRETNENGKREVRITAAVDAGAGPGSGPGPGAGTRGGGNGSARGASASSGGDGAMPAGWKLWHEEWSTIKGHLLSLMKPELQLEKLTPRQRLAVEFLQREGVDDSVVLALFKKLLPEPGASILDPLGDLVPVRAWGGKTWPQRLHLLGGPFGAGKTTAAVRLALLLRKTNPNLRIALVNADCERGGGRLVLRNYAELSDFEYRETDSRLETAAALADLESLGFDRIIVDLPGVPRNKTLAGALEENGFALPDAALHLVLPPHFDASMYRCLLDRYNPGPNGPREMSLLWSKLDEAERFGSLVNVSAMCKLPVSALSFGPGLRNTLTPARDAALWRLLFKRELPDAAG